MALSGDLILLPGRFRVFADPVELLVRANGELGQALFSGAPVGVDADQETVAVVILAPELDRHGIAASKEMSEPSST